MIKTSSNFSPQVSVIMPVYNGDRYLKKSVDSILDQTLRDFELIIIDDASTDRTAKILAHYVQQDQRIVLVRNRENLGITKSLNLAIERSRGEFIARMDADDISLPNRLQIQVEYLSQNPDCVAVGSQVLRIDPHGWAIGVWEKSTEHEVIETRFLQGLGGGIIHPSVMMPRWALEKVGGYDEAFEVAQDFDLFIRLASIGRLANVPHILLKYREHFHRLTHQKRALQLKIVRTAVNHAWQEHGLGNPPDDLMPHSKVISPVDKRQQWINIATTQGYYLTSCKHASAILAHKPYSLQAWKVTLKTWAKFSLSLRRRKS